MLALTAIDGVGGEGRFEAVQIHLTGRDAKIVKRGHGCGWVRFDAEDQPETESFLPSLEATCGANRFEICSEEMRRQCAG